MVESNLRDRIFRENPLLCVEIVIELIQPLIAAPVLPASILLFALVCWSLFMVFIGAGLGSDGNWSFHFHNPISGVLEGDPHVGLGHSVSHFLGDTLGSFVLAPTKWLNLRSVPFLVWIGVFALTWWAVSVVCWMALDEWLLGHPGPAMTVLLIGRNLAFALPFTKAITQPMIGWFADTGTLDSQSLIGAEAEISSFDATPESGQAKYKTGAAPLLLNIRTDGAHLIKGTRVWITHYDSKKRVYIVSPTTTDSKSPSTYGKSS
jgi:Protein of unknown function (DUF1449)